MNKSIVFTAVVAALSLAQPTAHAQQTPPDAVLPVMAAPPSLSLPSAPPKGAVVLFSGKTDEVAANWYERRSTNAPKWTIERGALNPTGRKDISSKMEFGDCFLHIEFKTPTEGIGNAGVGFQGRYEVQMMNGYGKPLVKNGIASLYSQTPPMFNASKKNGEWQAFDIIYRAPRFDAENKVVEKARATVFHNGVLVHNNAEFTGPTGIQYEQYKGEAKTGPLVLQGDHDPVQFRNIWVLPM